MRKRPLAAWLGAGAIAHLPVINILHIAATAFLIPERKGAELS
jgi:hypothetical protein